MAQTPEKISPMMQQYLDIKEKYRDYILFFRLGDFYEMFFEDAETVSRELELALTARACKNKALEITFKDGTRCIKELRKE